MTERVESKRAATRRGTFIPVNRNLCNFPLARDGRVKGRWMRSRSTGERWCALPGQARIELRLEADAPPDVKRVPTGFDTALLLALLGAAAVRKSATIECRSLTDVLAEMELAPRHRHREQAEAALALWSQMSMAHERWYSPGGKRGEFLPPPIRDVRRSPGRMIIRLRQVWVTVSGAYYAKVPPGLPVRATHQNLILWLLSAKPAAPQEDDTKYTRPLTRRKLCSIIGADHGTRNRALEAAIAFAERWFAGRGGRIEAFDRIFGDERMSFLVKFPTMRRKKSVPRKVTKKKRPATSATSGSGRPPRVVAISFAPSAPPKLAVKKQAPTEDGYATVFRLLDTEEYVTALPDGYKVIA